MWHPSPVPEAGPHEDHESSPESSHDVPRRPSDMSPKTKEVDVFCSL